MVPTPWRRVMKPSRSREARMSRSCVRLIPSFSARTLSRGRRSQLVILLTIVVGCGLTVLHVGKQLRADGLGLGRLTAHSHTSF